MSEAHDHEYVPARPLDAREDPAPCLVCGWPPVSSPHLRFAAFHRQPLVPPLEEDEADDSWHAVALEQDAELTAARPVLDAAKQAHARWIELQGVEAVGGSVGNAQRLASAQRAWMAAMGALGDKLAALEADPSCTALDDRPDDARRALAALKPYRRCPYCGRDDIADAQERREHIDACREQWRHRASCT